MTDDRKTNPKASPLYKEPVPPRHPERPTSGAVPGTDVEPGSDADATEEDFHVDPGLSRDS